MSKTKMELEQENRLLKRWLRDYAVESSDKSQQIRDLTRLVGEAQAVATRLLDEAEAVRFAMCDCERCATGAVH